MVVVVVVVVFFNNIVAFVHFLDNCKAFDLNLSSFCTAATLAMGMEMDLASATFRKLDEKAPVFRSIYVYIIYHYIILCVYINIYIYIYIYNYT